MKSVLKLADLSHKYTSNWAIQNIDIDIKSRGIFGLLGSNGAGKSTTMNIICGALTQTKGKVFINGIDLEADPIAAKRHIGYLPQSAPLYLDLTAREYLIYAARLRSIPKKQIITAVEQVMEQCGIAHVQHRLLKNLSGGYRQRVSIAQAIVHKPEVVIMDEPTNGLDPMQILEVRKLIKVIAQHHTVIFSSHILSEVQALCQQIMLIEQGQMVFSDTIDAFNNYVAPQSMQLGFENAPEESYLLKINGVNRVEKITEKQFRVFYNGETQVSEQLILESVAKGWRLTELSIEKNSVEEIFRQIIKK